MSLHRTGLVGDLLNLADASEPQSAKTLLIEAAEEIDSLREKLLQRYQHAYDVGYKDGLAAYAHWNDGIQYVGTNGRTLDDATRDRASTFNYKMP